jgi:hypothetical protein
MRGTVILTRVILHAGNCPIFIYRREVSMQGKCTRGSSIAPSTQEGYVVCLENQGWLMALPRNIRSVRTFILKKLWSKFDCLCKN